jgi:ketol-acid reductoisomerase
MAANATLNEANALTVYYDKDIDRAAILSKKVVVIGFGSQGFGQGANLKDSGATVKVALRSNSSTAQKVKEAGMDVVSMEEMVAWGDAFVFALPDVYHEDVFKQYFEGKMKAGQALIFSHGFSVHYGQVTPPADVDVFLVAPKGPGHLVRSEFQRERGVPALIAIHQDATGQAKDLALGYAACVGGGRGGVIETSFKNETETDLFGEQAVLCGGASALVKAGFETLVEAGYPPELAYFECLHELKLIVDLMYEGGLADMRYSISDTARYGDVMSGPRVVDEKVKAAMKDVLTDIQSGKFAREWTAEFRAGMPTLKQRVADDDAHELEQTGRKLRAMMPWLAEKTHVDRKKN